MARSNDNSITKSYSGKFGNICMQKDGIIRKLPDVSKRHWSDLQKIHHNRFDEGKKYARLVLSDPEKIAYYTPFLILWKKKEKKKNVGIYQIAIKDFYHPPSIGTLDFKWDNAHSTGTLIIGVSDLFDRPSVFVNILSPHGKVLQQGEAIFDNPIGDYRFLVKPVSLLHPGT